MMDNQKRDQEERDALRVALGELGEMEDDCDLQPEEVRRRVLRAFVAARRMLVDPCHETSEDAPAIVATAFWMATRGLTLEDCPDIAPLSLVGERLVNFARVLGALKAQSLADELLDDETMWIDSSGSDLLGPREKP